MTVAACFLAVSAGTVNADPTVGKDPSKQAGESIWVGPAAGMVDHTSQMGIKLVGGESAQAAGTMNLRAPGACCDANSVCTVAEITACPTGTLFFVPGETCGPNSCNIACCGPDGSCVFAASWNACAWIGFSPAPVASGSVCTPNPCIQPACAGSSSCQAPPAATAAGGIPAGVAGSSSDAIAISATNPGFNTADNFRAAATGSVTQLCFYGFFGGGGSFAAIPTNANMSFRIRYYADGAGKPGAQIGSDFIVGGATPTAGTSLNLSNFFYNQRWLYNDSLVTGFQVTHPAVAVTSGNCYWVEITHLSAVNNDPANRFRWLTAATPTDSYYIQKNGQVDPVSNPWQYADLQSNLGDKAFCVNISIQSPSGCSHLPPPANANCSTAQLITPGFTATNSQTISGGGTATGFCGANFVSGGQVWYRVVGNGTTMTASTCGPNTSFDTIINVYCGSCAAGNNGALNCVADNDTGPASCTGGANSDPSQVSWPTLNGTSYYILVSGFQSDAGFFDFSLTSDGVQTTAPACGNDRCPLDNSAITTAEVDACGVDTEADCGTGSNVCVLGVPVKGTINAANGLRDIDVWNLQPALPANTWVRVTIENEFPMLHQGVEGYYCPGAATFSVMTLDDGTGYGEVVPYKPCGPKTFTALTASGNVNIVITATDFFGLPCTDGNNDYRFTITLAATGACCVPNTAGCFVTVQSDCTRAAIGGNYFGDNSTCSPEPCFGACCGTDGACTFVSPTACASASGQFQGGNTTCTSGPCDVLTYACCTGGTCSLTSVTGCTGGGGTVNGFACTPNPCAPQTGACCCGSGCSITTAAACSGTNQRFAGTGTVCNAANNFTTPCCKGDYNKSAAGNVVSVQDIFDFLAGYFSGSLCADTNGSGTISVQDIFDFLSAYFGGC